MMVAREDKKYKWKKERSNQMNAIDAAKWFIKQGYDTPFNTFDGNMKLQKLLYFSQLIHLARTGKFLFNDKVYAFKNGSVVENVRQRYKNFYILLAEEANALEELKFDESEIETLVTTAEIFGNINAKELSTINHLHISWQKAFEQSKRANGYYDKDSSEISFEAVKKYDLPRVKEMLNAYKTSHDLQESSEVINDVTFYYDPKELQMTDDIIGRLELFEGIEPSYDIYLDRDLGLVIY